MASRAARRHHRRTPCVLCLEPIAGFRAELGATWIAHATCFDALADQLHRGRPEYAALPRRSDEHRTLVRAHLTRIARRLYARQQPTVNGRGGPAP